MRILSALALSAALAMAFTVTAGGVAEAKKASAKNKSCIATNTATKKKVSWSCKADEICCYNPTINKGSCSPKATGFCL